MESPLGELTLVARGLSLCAVLWENDRFYRNRLPRLLKDPTHRTLLCAQEQITAYFRSELKAFDLPLDLLGSEFQMKVWKALLDIPFGKVESYSSLAKIIGLPQACRAVGTANSRNPLSIIVPCHRVVSKTGALAGFSGGLSHKAYLLDLEKAGP
jgi:methylated-DNA-[protein]-cysteine S-methyltransferase